MPKISQLPSSTVPSNSDYFPIVDNAGTITEKITRGDFFTGSPLPANTVDTQAISNNAVTTGKMNNGAVTAAKTAFGGNYSTSEVDTGFTWVDGKTIYKKTINFGTLPNNTSTNVAHGVTGVSAFISNSGYAVSSTTFLPLPYAATAAANSIQLAVSGNNINIQTGTDRTGFSAYVTLFYTKT